MSKCMPVIPASSSSWKTVHSFVEYIHNMPEGIDNWLLTEGTPCTGSASSLSIPAVR